MSENLNWSEQEFEKSEIFREVGRKISEKSGPNWNWHLTTILARQTVSRILVFDRLYREIIGVAGSIAEFGVQWGAGSALFANLRAIHEPFNYMRRIISFDTFQGFKALSQSDFFGGGVSEGKQEGAYSSEPGWENILDDILDLHELNSPVAHIKKHEIVVGDVVETLPAWLEENRHEVFAMAFFDMDLYEPTCEAIRNVLPRMNQGGILVFDEFNDPNWPGETLAAREMGLVDRLQFYQDPRQPKMSWARVL